jgi:hypothetical protein
MPKPGGDPSSGISLGDALRLPKRHPAYRRREPQLGSCTERENLAGDAKGKGTSSVNRETESTDAPARDGPLRSNVEAGVMPVERRKRVIAIGSGQPVTGRTRLSMGKRQLSRDGTSRMNREVPRTVVCPVKAGVFSRKQTCRGNSQEPRSSDSRVAGNQDPEAYRQGLPRGDYESPGRNDSERGCGLENEWLRGPSPQP